VDLRVSNAFLQTPQSRVIRLLPDVTCAFLMAAGAHGRPAVQ
jgi:hypothetical protein